jgi:potassium/hydrogen antiporter
MDIIFVFLILAGILFVGFIGEIIFQRSGIPDVVWLLLIGIALGLFFSLKTSVALQELAPFFTTFALIFLLFEAGMNTDIKSFIKSAPRGLQLSFLGFILSFAVLFGIGLLMGLGVNVSILMGMILAGISSAVVLPFVKQMSMGEEAKLSLVFDSAFSDVLCILGTVTVIEIFTLESSTVNGLAIASSVLSSFLIAIALGVIAAFIWNKLIRKLIVSHQVVLTLAFMLVVYSLTQLLNANGAIAGLVFGLILGNAKKIKTLFETKKSSPMVKSNASEKKEAAQKITDFSLLSLVKSSKDFYGELAFFIKTFFFVYLGILINFSELGAFGWALLILVGLYLVRPIAVFLSFGKKTARKDVLLLETLIPKGLAAAVLVQLPIQAGIAGADALVNIALAVIFLSILASTVFAFFIQRDAFKGVLPFLHKKYRKE